MTDELQRLHDLKPKRPPSKQKKVDLWLAEIEKKQTEDGASLDEIAEVLFPEIKPATFRVMVRRAKIKREKNAPPASPSASATKNGDSAHASSKKASSPSKLKRSLTKRSREQRADAPAVSCSEGGGGATPEQLAICRDTRGSLLTSQDERIPPPWSDDPVRESDLPGDLPNRGILMQCQTWLEVHFYLSIFNDSKDRFMGTGPNTTTLKKLMEKRYPDEEDRARGLRKKRDTHMEM